MKIKMNYRINPKNLIIKVRKRLASVTAKDWYEYTVGTITILVGLAVVLSIYHTLNSLGVI